MKKKPFPCPDLDPSTGKQCSMAFETAGHLRAHQARMHVEKRFSCAECSQQPENQASTTSDDANDENGEVNVTFPTYALLQAHIKSVHPPRCPSCSFTGSTPRELRRHLEITHGHVNVEQRKIFPCTVPGCGRSFTKSGNLTVHIRTVHQGEKRFACGETDLSNSRKAEGWTGEGCGKRYGSKLALEEHVRTAHLGYQNTKAERRQRLGLTSKGVKGNSDANRSGSRKNGDSQTQTQTINGDEGEQPGLSTLAALTGDGYVEESGRRITCFYEDCPHRFHRDYDLWVHMVGKHDCTEDEVQNHFLRRALLEANREAEDKNDPLGIYTNGADSATYASGLDDIMPGNDNDNDDMLIDPILACDGKDI